MVILLLGLAGSRWITRPVESIEKELAIHKSAGPHACAVHGSFSDFERLIQIITDYVKDHMNRGVAQVTLRAFRTGDLNNRDSNSGGG